MARAVSCFLPDTVACTAPPPTEAVKLLSSTFFWALSISCCILASFCCICCCWRIIPALPPNPLRALYPLAMVEISFIILI